MNPENAPHVVVSPAMGVRARFYRPLIDALVEHGWTASVAPRRGIESGDVGPARRRDWSYVDEAHDLGRKVADCRALHPDRPILVLGHSMGAQLCALVAAGRGTDGSLPDGYVIIAGSLPWRRYYPRGGMVEYAVAATVPPTTAILGYWPKAGFGGPTPRTLMREWARMVRSGRVPWTAAAQPAGPVLAVRLDGDSLVTPDAASALERHFDAGARTVWTYGTDACPPDGSLDHLRWVRTPEPVVERIVAWWSDQSRIDRAVRRNTLRTAETTPSTARPIIDA